MILISMLHRKLKNLRISSQDLLPRFMSIFILLNGLGSKYLLSFFFLIQMHIYSIEICHKNLKCAVPLKMCMPPVGFHTSFCYSRGTGKEKPVF